MKLSFFLGIVLYYFSNVIYAMPSYDQRLNPPPYYSGQQPIVPTQQPAANNTFSSTSPRPIEQSAFSSMSSIMQQPITQPITTPSYPSTSYQNRNFELQKQKMTPSPIEVDNQQQNQKATPATIEVDKTREQTVLPHHPIQLPHKQACDNKFIPYKHIHKIEEQSMQLIDGFTQGITKIQDRVSEQLSTFLDVIQLYWSNKIDKDGLKTQITQEMRKLNKDVQNIEDLSRYKLIGSYPDIAQFICDCANNSITNEDIFFLQDYIEVIKDQLSEKQFKLWDCFLHMTDQIDELFLVFTELDEKVDDQYQQLIVSMVSRQILNFRTEIREFKKEIVNQLSGVNSSFKTLKKNLNELHSKNQKTAPLDREKIFFKNENLNLKDKLNTFRAQSDELRNILRKIIQDQTSHQARKIKRLKHKQKRLKQELEHEERSLLGSQGLFFYKK